MNVPSACPVASEEDIAAVVRVLRSGVLANGPESAGLEEEFAVSCGTRHAIAVSSGTDALYLAGRAIGIGPGRLVLSSGFSFAATANAFLSLGARVLPVDIDLGTMNMCPDALRDAIAAHPECVAVVLVDLYGNTAGTDRSLEVAQEAGLPVIEDACQAHGATGHSGKPVGTRATCTAFSLYATKNLAAGEGGILTTQDDELALQLRLLRNHGCATPYKHEIVGLNHRLPEMSATLARSRLRRLQAGNDARRRLAADLASWCSVWPTSDVTPEVPADPTHVFHQFTILLPDRRRRDLVLEALRARGVDARVHYPYTVADLPQVEPTSLPRAIQLRERVLSLPVAPELTEAQRESMHDAIVAIRDGPWWE
ncbi:MAG: DegT/DnrJ/EryC1/StrS family aminotransferase [Acidimicrobiales bacterium]